ncbi:hypothetical protein [Thauera linaloolentis]|uniref:hypothetical protein n=1 Tax=Thauera linaloolentis TaxID=76112 RepID=UPI0012B58BBE|nr:hypothetical protein [Thauera linaloolentis]MCM8565445.1 hypothetical protein [Thauera linaloolentis]
MRRILVLFVLGSFAQFAQAQSSELTELCKSLADVGKKQATSFDARRGCITRRDGLWNTSASDDEFLPVDAVSATLLGKQLTTQNALLQQIRELRQELAANTAKLEETRKAYDAANAKASAWRDDSLKTLVEEVKAAPSELAANPILQEALLPVVAAKLLADPAFIDAVRGTSDSLRNGQQQ